MQATALGRYLFYGAPRATSWPPARPGPLPGVPALQVPVPVAPGRHGRDVDEPVRSVAAPSPAADWRVDVADAAFAVSLPDTGRVLAVDGSGRLIAAPRGAGRARFTFEPRTGCARYPEVERRRDRRAVARRELLGRGLGPDRRPHAHDGLRVPRRPGALRAPLAPLRRRLRDGRLPRPRAARRRRGRREHDLLRQPGRLPRHHRLADLQGLAQPRLADPRAELLQVARALLARRPAGVREPAGRQRRAVRGLSVQEELLQRDGRRAAPEQAHPRAAGLHRRPERRAGQGLVPDRHDARTRRAA